MRIVVTGGAGFVGSHLCDRLVSDGHQVVAIDDFTTGSPENVAHLLGRPGFRLLEHDVAEPWHLACDRIFNLACPASPVHYQADPVKTTLTSVLGAVNALRVAHEHGARFLQASTSEVYGDPTVHPQPETYLGNVSTTGPRACYDEGKRCAESLIMDFHRIHGVETRIARIFNTYGPRMAQDDGRVVSNFVVQALQGEPLTIYGEGMQTRSFCFVSDLVEGLVRLMASDEVMPVNLGNPQEFTMLELAERVLRLTGSSSELVRRPLPPDVPRQRRPDISRARRILGFAPRVPLEVGLTLTIEDFRARLARAAGTGTGTATATAAASAFAP